MKRMIDANLNRICEGLRVIEDYLRFEIKNDEYIKSKIDRLKFIRHFIRENIKINNSIKSRDSLNDPGKKFTAVESNRNNEKDILIANFYRVEEGLRVLEETFKALRNQTEIIKNIKKFRFEIYNIEKETLIYIFKKNINFKNILMIEITSQNQSIFNKIISTVKKMKQTAILIKSNNLSNKLFYDKFLLIKNLCNKNNIPLIIHNKLDVAIISDCEIITADSDNIDISVIKNQLNKITGYIPQNLNEIKSILKYNVDFILISSNILLDKKIFNFYKDKIKIAKEVTENFIISGNVYKFFKFIN